MFVLKGTEEEIKEASLEVKAVQIGKRSREIGPSILVLEKIVELTTDYDGWPRPAIGCFSYIFDSAKYTPEFRLERVKR